MKKIKVDANVGIKKVNVRKKEYESVFKDVHLNKRTAELCIRAKMKKLNILTRQLYQSYNEINYLIKLFYFDFDVQKWMEIKNKIDAVDFQFDRLITFSEVNPSGVTYKFDIIVTKLCELIIICENVKKTKFTGVAHQLTCARYTLDAIRYEYLKLLNTERNSVNVSASGDCVRIADA